jgi:hypothetical protein
MYGIVLIIQKCVVRCGAKPIFIIVHHSPLILILWIVSTCSSSFASSQLLFLETIDVENNPDSTIQGIAQVFVLNFVTF